MTTSLTELRQLLAAEVKRHRSRLDGSVSDPQLLRPILHALRGSAAMAQETDLALVVAQISADLRQGDTRRISPFYELLLVVAQRLEAGLPAFDTSWPEPPPLLETTTVDPRYTAEYRAALGDRLLELDDALSAPDPATGLRQAQRSVHSLKGAAASVGDDLTAWYCHGLESWLRGSESHRADEVLLELPRHRALLAVFLDDPRAALRLLTSLRPATLPSKLPRAEPALGRTPTAGTLPDPDAPLRISSAAADRLLERIERVHLIRDELRAAAATAQELADCLRSNHARLAEVAHLLSANPEEPPLAVALERLSTATAEMAAANSRAEGLAELARRHAESVHLGSTAMRSEVAALRRTTARWLFDRVEQAVVRLTRAAGQRVVVRREGDDVPIERRIAERLLEPMLQLAQNAIVHGVEPAEQRQAAGKPAAGTLLLRAEPLGDWLRLVVEDDGAGADIERVRTRAQEFGAVSAKAASLAHPEELLGLLFLPGLSTRDSADLAAGRGVGLELVQAVVRRLGGGVRLRNRPGQGLTAVVEIPAESGMVDVLWVECDGHEVALPMSFTGAVRPLESAPSAVPLAACLGLPPPHSPTLALELRLHGVQPIFLGIDAAGTVEDAFLRALPPLLALGGPFSGAILRSDGSLRVVLDAALIAARAWSQDR